MFWMTIVEIASHLLLDEYKSVALSRIRALSPQSCCMGTSLRLTLILHIAILLLSLRSQL